MDQSWVPAENRVRWWMLPRLAWVVARGCGALRGRPGWVGDVWAVPTALLLHLPPLVAAHLLGAAAHVENRAVVIAVPDRRSNLALSGPILVLALAIWYLVMFTVAEGIGDGLVTITQSVLDISPVGEAVLLGIGLVLGLIPLYVCVLVDVAVLLSRGGAGQVAEAASVSKNLRRGGGQVWTVGTWAAWPPGTGAGRQLVQVLAEHAPVGVTLVATPRTAFSRAQLVRLGFQPQQGSRALTRPPTHRSQPDRPRLETS